MTYTLAAEPGIASNIALLSAWIELQMAYRGLPGLSIGIVHDQDLIWARGFGLADREAHRPAAADTLYRIASITKLFTATAILQLRDAGKLQLDDPVAKHLAWFKPPARFADAPAATIRHLLTHTAGVAREAPFPYWTTLDFPAIEAIRAALPNQEPALPTETTWKYSNLGLTLAGEIVAALSGEAYADYVARHVLAPLGMAATLVAAPDPAHAKLATGHARRMPDGGRAAAPYTDTKGIAAAANMTSNVEDLARFAMLQFRAGLGRPKGGAQILSGTTLAEMQRIHWLEPDWQAGWGLGFRIFRRAGKTIVGHGGSVRGYRTDLALSPADKVAVIVLINADDGEPMLFSEKAFQWVAPAIVKATAPPAAATADPAWQTYVGKYRNAWGDVEVLVLDGALVMLPPQALDPLWFLSRLVPDGAHRFRIAEKAGFGANGELAVFELDAAGRVARLKVGENYLLPVETW